MDPKDFANAKPHEDDKSRKGAPSSTDLDDLSRKAIEAAKQSTDPEVMLKAVQLNDAVEELKRKRRGGKWLQFAQTLAPYTAISAVILSLITVAVQFHQFNTTLAEQRETAETTQWREAIKDLSTKDDSAVMSSAMEMQTFFASPQYAPQARTSAAALLPLLGDGSQFDVVWKGMVEMPAKDQGVLIAVDRSIASEEFTLFHTITQTAKVFSNSNVDLQFVSFLADPDRPEFNASDPGRIRPVTTSQLSPGDASSKSSNESLREEQYARDGELKPIKRALASSWKLDSISNTLGKVWRNNGIAPVNADLSAIVLINADLSKIDFSQTRRTSIIIHNCVLNDAKFQDAKLDQAILTQISQFQGSKWDRSSWWDADLIDCGLASYLKENYPPPDAASESRASSVLSTCSH